MTVLESEDQELDVNATASGASLMATTFTALTAALLIAQFSHLPVPIEDTEHYLAVRPVQPRKPFR